MKRKRKTVSVYKTIEVITLILRFFHQWRLYGSSIFHKFCISGFILCYLQSYSMLTARPSLLNNIFQYSNLIICDDLRVCFLAKTFL